MTAQPRTPLFDAVVRVDSLPVSGRRWAVTADDEQLQHLAAVMQVSAFSSFSANLVIEKFRGGVRATGQLAAKLTQPCVVTFVPIEQEIDQTIDRIFMPGPGIGDDSPPGSELFVDLESDDIPDHFSGVELDLAPLLLEVLGLAIDLYPRAPGAELPKDVDDGDDESLHPFAALKALKTGTPDRE